MTILGFINSKGEINGISRFPIAFDRRGDRMVSLEVGGRQGGGAPRYPGGRRGWTAAAAAAYVLAVVTGAPVVVGTLVSCRSIGRPHTHKKSMSASTLSLVAKLTHWLSISKTHKSSTRAS